MDRDALIKVGLRRFGGLASWSGQGPQGRWVLIGAAALVVVGLGGLLSLLGTSPAEPEVESQPLAVASSSSPSAAQSTDAGLSSPAVSQLPSPPPSSPQPQPVPASPPPLSSSLPAASPPSPGAPSALSTDPPGVPPSPVAASRGSVSVDSFAETYPLSVWAVDGSRTAGWVDTLTIDPPQAPGAILDDRQQLILTGWAGESELGLRPVKVLFSLCDTVVGAANVGSARPDVAQKVHPNLGNSGWQIRLLIGHLPRCEGSFLEGWAVAPSGQMLFALNGRIRTSLSPRDTAVSLESFVPAPIVRPSPRPLLVEVSLTVSQTVPLLRAAGVGHAVVATLDPGRYQGFVVEERDDWVLVIMQDKGGWAPGDWIRVAR